MFSLHCIAICATLLLVGFTNAGQLPSYFTPCKRDEPTQTLSACILAQARHALPYFIKGVPELGIESMDPLALDDFTANTGTFKLKERNAVLKGLSKMEIRDLKWDLVKNTGLLKIFGNLTLNSDYDADGRVLIIPITGTGKLNVKMYNTEITLKYKIKKMKGADGVDHISTYDLKATQTYGNVKLHLSNILGGNAVIGDTINRVLNDNWADLFREVGPSHTKTISNKVHNIINQLYSQVPYDEIIV